MRKGWILFLLLLCVTLGLNDVWAQTGVALVHGKGKNKLNDPQAAVDYWTRDMIRAVTSNYKYPYVVVHYNGEAYMWEAANGVADQLTRFINQQHIKDLVIITHSFGGTVMRWIFSNPDYDSRYRTIINNTRWVTTIAAPAKGSEAADMADELSGSWLVGWLIEVVGQGTDATKNCMTSVMNNYNRTKLYGTPGRPSLPRPFKWISGYGLWNNWEPADIGLATLSGIVGMPGEDDGVVSEYSAQAVGQRFMRTEANHNHNRRNDFDKIGDAVGADIDKGARRSNAPYAPLAAIQPWDSRSASIRFSGCLVPGHSNASYEVRSTRYVEFTGIREGQAQREVTLYLQADSKADIGVFALNAQEQRGDFSVMLNLAGRAGTVNEQTIPIPALVGIPTTQARTFSVTTVPAGTHSLTIQNSRSSEDQVYAVVVNTHTAPILKARLASDVLFAGDTLKLEVTLEDELALRQVQLAGALYRAGVKDYTPLDFKVAGTHKGSIRYHSQQVVGTDVAFESGAYFIRITASGERANGEKFKRSALVSFERPNCCAHLQSPCREVAVRQDGKIQMLIFKVPVNVEQAGRYRLYGELSAYNNGQWQPVVWAQTTRQANVGESSYYLYFQGQALAAAGLNGPYRLQLSLSSMSQLTPVAPKCSGYQTAPYTVAEFSTP